MVILNKKAFKLPRLEKDKFVLLMRLGLQYDQASSTFCVSSYKNIEKVIDTLGEILNDKNVGFLQSCIICDRDFPCLECRYYEICDTKNLPFKCVCGRCLEEGSIISE